MDRFEISTLRCYYGSLLTKRQNGFLHMHYDEDLSLGEIAENEGVSRQAVLDAVRKGEKALIDFEEKLHLLERDGKIVKLLDELSVAKDCSSVRETAEIIRRLIVE